MFWCILAFVLFFVGLRFLSVSVVDLSGPRFTVGFIICFLGIISLAYGLGYINEILVYLESHSFFAPID